MELYLEQSCCLLYADVIGVNCLTPATITVTLYTFFIVISVRAEVLLAVEADAERLVTG